MSNTKTKSVDDIELTELEPVETNGAAPLLKGNLDVIKNVRVKLDIMIGEAEMAVADLFALKRDSIVKIDKDISAPIDVVLDGQVVARGSLVAVGDNFGVRITEISAS